MSKQAPAGWTICRLGDALTLINGRAYKQPEMLSSGTPILRIQNLNGGENWFYSNLELPEDKYCVKGDLLYAWSATFGPYWSRWDYPVIYHYHIWKIKPSFCMTKEFAFYELLRITSDLKASAHGVAMPHITKAGMEDWQIFLPPLAEQKVIADKLDTLLAQVETTKARLERIPEILKSFRQSVLNAAVTGKLTEEWRETYESVSVIQYLKEIEQERIKLINAKKLKKSVIPRTTIEQIESDLPNSWSIVHFEHIAAYDSNALKAGPFGSALKKSDCTSSGFRVYGQEQVIAGDERLVTYYINESKFNELSSCAVASGDILVSLVGTIGKVLILSDNAEKGIINPRLVKLSLQPEINRSYIQFYLQSIVALDFFKGFSHGGTMDILNLGILKDLPINLPPLKEQAEIVRRVEQLFAFADSIEQKANAALARVNNLTQSILAKAFRGELTADWRAANPDLITGDNSAEALLAKIKAERAKLAKKSKAKA